MTDQQKAILATIFAWLAKAAPTTVRDIAGLAGVGLISAGLAQVYSPLAWISAGIFLLVFAIKAGPRQAD